MPRKFALCPTPTTRLRRPPPRPPETRPTCHPPQATCHTPSRHHGRFVRCDNTLARAERTGHGERRAAPGTARSSERDRRTLARLVARAQGAGCSPPPRAAAAAQDCQEACSSGLPPVAAASSLPPEMADKCSQLRASLREIARLLLSMATIAANTADTVAGAGQCASGVLLWCLTQRPLSQRTRVSAACAVRGEPCEGPRCTVVLARRS